MSTGSRRRQGPTAADTTKARWGWGTIAVLGFFLQFSHYPAAFSGTAAVSDAASSAPAAGEVGSSSTDHFLTDCDGVCAISLFSGQQVLTRLPDIALQGRPLPWDWQWGNSQLVGAAISRRLLTWHAFDIEPELGFAKRFGSMHTDEAWLAVYFRWTRFPWDQYVRTSIAFSLGVSAAVDLPAGGHDAYLYNYFSPEVTFALPRYPQYQLLFQFHHRSNLGIWNATDPGWQYLTAGLRYQF